jgi:hypothetical protein
MTEVDVALTDYILCAETAWFAFALYRLGDRTDLARYFVITFISLSIASFLGGTSHGFFSDPASEVYAVLWWATLVAIGVTAAGFGLAGYSLLKPAKISGAGALVMPVLVAYAIVTYIKPDFLIAILFYLPAILLCLAGFIAQSRRSRGQGAIYGVVGIVLSLVASLGQQLGISLHPVYLSHNAVYHVSMIIALFLVYRGVRQVLLHNAGHAGK